jgi:hypothetical protein
MFLNNVLSECSNFNYIFTPIQAEKDFVIYSIKIIPKPDAAIKDEKLKKDNHIDSVEFDIKVPVKRVRIDGSAGGLIFRNFSLSSFVHVTFPLNLWCYKHYSWLPNFSLTFGVNEKANSESLSLWPFLGVSLIFGHFERFALNIGASFFKLSLSYFAVGVSYNFTKLKSSDNTKLVGQ